MKRNSPAKVRIKLSLIWFNHPYLFLSGQQTIRSYWRNYYEQTDGLIFVIDSADKRRMEMCKAELHQLLKQEKLAGASLLIFSLVKQLNRIGWDRMRKFVFPIIDSMLMVCHLIPFDLFVFSNKQDLAGALSQEEIAKVLDLSTLGETGRHWRIVGCSAWTGDGLIQGVDWIVNDIAGRIYMME